MDEDEIGKRRKIQCKDGIKWDILCVTVTTGIRNPQAFILKCTSDGGKDIAITAPKPLDMMKEQELCDLIESKQSKP